MWYFLLAFKNYMTFNGRSSRKAYWSFFAVDLAILVVLGAIDGLAASKGDTMISPPRLLLTAYSLLRCLPNASILFRRLHDVGRSGWWSVLGLIGLMPLFSLLLLPLTLKESDPEANKYGPNPCLPKGEQSGSGAK
jgi:uncharacterized membrane protein YhaH (DUF805 family)